MGFLSRFNDPMGTGANGKGSKSEVKGTGATVRIPRGGTDASYRAALNGRLLLRRMQTGSDPNFEAKHKKNLENAVKALEKANNSGDITKINRAHGKLKKYLPH